MLFKRSILERIATGEITSAYRLWRRPTVKAGGRLRTPVGEIAIEGLTPIRAEDITQADARRAGATTREALLAGIGAGEGQLYRIDFRLSGPDPRLALANDPVMSDEQLRQISNQLARPDAASRDGTWTRAVLMLIAEQPGIPAKDLAARLGRDAAQFKRRVRALKELGLTQSLAQGYRLSPRGQEAVFRAEVIWPDSK